MGFNSLGCWIQALDATGRLRLYVLTDITSTSGTVTVSISGQPISVAQTNLGGFDQPDVTVNQSVATGLRTSEQVRLGASDQPDITVNQVGSLKTTPAARTRIDGQSYPITSLAGATAEAVVKTGALSIAPGNTVWFMLGVSAGTTLTTPANDAVYVAIKGATSSAYYAVAYFGEVAMGSFAGVSNEKLNIVSRNQDTVAHTMNGTYLVTST